MRERSSWLLGDEKLACLLVVITTSAAALFAAVHFLRLDAGFVCSLLSALDQSEVRMFLKVDPKYPEGKYIQFLYLVTLFLRSLSGNRVLCYALEELVELIVASLHVGGLSARLIRLNDQKLGFRRDVSRRLQRGM